MATPPRRPMDETNCTSASAEKSSRPAHFTCVQNAPVSLVIVERVASFISDTMVGHFFDELATRNPKYYDVLPNAHRQDLLSMCLVHRTWSPIVQRVLRKRVRIHTPKRLKGFLESAVCGPWVVELWYICNKVSSDEMEESLAAVGENEKSHWDLLAELLTRLPNLRFLSVELNDKPDSYSEQEKIRKELEKKEASQALSENASATRDDDSYEKVCREEGFEYSGVRDVLSAIGKLSNLEGLVLLCDAVHIERFKSISTRSSRYFPYFALVCQQLPNLTSLKYLHIRGWSGWYDMEADEEPEYEDFRRDEADEEEEDGEEKSKVQVDKEPLSECLVDKSPPASLKTLVLELPHYRFPTSHIKWLQVPQGNYAVENLFVRFNVDCNFMHAICWSGALGEMSRVDLALMPALKNVRLEFPDKCLSGIGHVAEFERMLRQGVSKLLSQRLTNVRTLQAAPIFLDATVPPTLEELHIVLDRVRYEPRSMWTDRNNRDEIWQRRDRTIKDLLHDMRHQISERRVVVTSMDTEDAIEDVLPNTIGYCDDVGIDLYTADERGVHNRICDFLLLGQVQYPGGERSLVDDVCSDDGHETDADDDTSEEGDDSEEGNEDESEEDEDDSEGLV